MKKRAYLSSIGGKFTVWMIVLMMIIVFIVGAILYTNNMKTMNDSLNARVQLALDSVKNLSEMYVASFQNVENQIIGAINDKLKSNIDVAMSIVDNYYTEYDNYVKAHPDMLPQAKQLLEKQYQQKALEAVGVLRYDNGVGYIWINDMKGVMLEHPKKSLINKSVYDLQDKNGKYLFREMIKVCSEKGEGFVDYLWPKPGKEGPQPKRSFVKEFKPRGWI